MVVEQLDKLNERSDDWQRKVIIRTDIPKRIDDSKIPHYRKHKDKLYTKQHGKCAGCGFPFQSFILEIDHDILQSKGGTDHISNLHLLCPRCNSIKGTRSMAYLKNELRRREEIEGW